MLKVRDYKFWFVAGSQFLYGEEQLDSVAKDAQKNWIVEATGGKTVDWNRKSMEI